MSAEIPDGAVIVARAIVNSSLWKMRPEDRVVAMTCMAIANKRARKWFDGEQDIMIQRGQFARSREQMVTACCMPLQVVRTSLDHLEEVEFLTRNVTRWYTLYTIPKYQHYQDLTKYSDSGVQKLTRFLTRDQPGISAKSNPEFAHKAACNHPESQVVAGLCKLCGENLTREKEKTNHKQQQHIPRPIRTKTEGDGPLGEGFDVVVQNGWADPILGFPSYLFSLKLLEGIRMAKSVAMTYANVKPVGLILRVVHHAKLQRQPGGWARTALENGWHLPEADQGDLRAAITALKMDAERAAAQLPGKSSVESLRERFPKKDGESDDQWFKRVSQELVETKKGGKRK